MRTLFACLSIFTFLSGCARTVPAPRPAAPADPRVALAECLAARGVKLYGASWCGYCAQQEELFGPAFAAVPHVECSPPGTRGQIAECREAGIEGYPTWVFPDGRRYAGLMTLAEVARESFCPWNSSQ